MATPGTSIRTFLADGTPDGLRTVEKSNWTGLAVVVPRSLYLKLRTRPELQRPAGYVLRGTSDNTPGRSRLYMGEADIASSRIDRHVRTLDWGDDLIIFTSKDENLNKAYVRHFGGSFGGDRYSCEASGTGEHPDTAGSQALES